MGYQHRPEVRATDADVHDIGVAPAAAADAAVAHAIAEGLHALERGAHLRHDVFAIDHHRLFAAQCRMQHRSVFRDIDLSAAEQLAHLRAEPAFARQRCQQVQGVQVDEVLRVIEQQAVKMQGKISEALRVRFEQLRNAGVRHGLLVVLQCQPGGGFGQRGHAMGLGYRSDCSEFPSHCPIAIE